MSLDVYLVETREVDIFESNITHNLGKMAAEAGIYTALWRPEDIGAKKATDIIKPLRIGLAALCEAPDYFRTFDSPNGWGQYRHLVQFVEEYLGACEASPEARIVVSR